MRVFMHDRLLTGHYLMPIVLDHGCPDPQPYPAALEQPLAERAAGAACSQAATGGDADPRRGRLAVRGVGCRAAACAGAQTAGGPADSLWAEWVVLDTARVVVAPGVAPAGRVSVRGHGVARGRLRARAPRPDAT